MTRFKYHSGDCLGPNNILMLKRTVKKSKKWYGKFKCPYCGKIFETKIDSVVSGDTSSCGCKKQKDLTGKQFGRWTVISFVGNKRWLCKCTCGTEREVVTSSLTSGASKSCGCYNAEQTSCRLKKDLTGQIFGSLTVLADDGTKTNNGHIKWKCRCKCGKIHYVAGGNLVSGVVRSCGCEKSRGELKIGQLLQSLKILYITQHTFSDCVNPITDYKLRFDFYLPSKNICIEFDGEQHFQECKNWCSDTLKERKERDEIKNEYCRKNDIKMIRIPYWDYNKLNEEYLLNLIN